MSEEEDGPTTFVQTLFECASCNAHRLPTRTSAAAYSAEEFRKDSVLPVEVKVKTWSFEKAAVEVYSNSVLFAVCPLNGERFADSVERANGSSRYFALKVVR